MSIIYGVINKKGNAVTEDVVMRMQRTFAHRIKDYTGELIHQNVFLGFERTVIYHNQENEKMPLESGDLMFVANAHLHNRTELISKLGFDEKEYGTTPDSYLILKSFERWGENCVHHLDGEYVYAIWDKVKQELFLSCDHMGFKNIYYYDSPELFVFCSQIKGIEAVKTTPNYFDAEFLREYLLKQSDPRATYNKEIKSLDSGSVLKLAQEKVAIKKYWVLASSGKYRFTKDEEWYECLRAKIISAVQKRLNPDVPVGVSLSGGLDSSGVACVLSGLLKKHNKPLYAFSSVVSENYTGDQKDEKEFINIVGQHCGNIIQTNVTAEGLGPYDNIGRSFARDEYMPNKFHFMNHALLESAAAKKIRILYFGAGGDHWISHNGNKVIARMIQKGQLLESLRLLQQLAKHQKTSFFDALKSEVIIHTFPAKKYYGYKNPWTTESFLQGQWQKTPSYMFPDRSNGDAPFLINNGVLSRLLQLLDTSIGSYGMTPASPFLDREIMELMIDVPPALFIKNGTKRNLFRKAMEGILPPAIQKRSRKSPYVVDFFERATDIREKLSDTLESQKCQFVFEHYLSKTKVQKWLNVHPERQQSLDYAKRYMGKGTHIIIICEVLGILNEKNYIFEPIK